MLVMMRSKMVNNDYNNDANDRLKMNKFNIKQP